MLRLFCWVVLIVFLIAAQAVFACEVPPMALRQHIAQYPVVYVGECEVEALKYPTMACAVYYDQERDLRYVILALDGKNVTHIVVVDKEGTGYVLWVRSDLAT